MAMAQQRSRLFRPDQTTARLTRCQKKKTSARHNLAENQESQEEEFNLRLARYEKKLTLLEAVYHNLLSDDFCYHIGQLGPDMDLFFLNVLLNRREMAEIFWERSTQPVRSAITAAYLLRRMAEQDGVEPAVQVTMRENADLFEDHAIGVLSTAAKSDRQEAALALDCQLRLWTGLTLLDLAVKSECGRFVVCCCQEALQARLYGDMDPYTNSMPRILLNIAGVGMPGALVDSFLQWRPPPLAEVMRGGTQRRKRPEGYPYKLSAPVERGADAHTRTGMQRKQRTKGRGNSKELTARELNELCQSKFTRMERWQLFWKAPVVLYIVSTVLSCLVTIVFTDFFVYSSPRLAQQTDPATPAPAPEPIAAPFAAELVVMVYHISAMFREFLQIARGISVAGFLSGVWNYISDSWNLMDTVSIVTFFAGFSANHYSHDFPPANVSDTAGNSLSLFGVSLYTLFGFEKAPFVWEFHSGEMCYGLSLCMMYLRLLRSFVLNERINVIVKIFFKMMRDVMRFIIMYVIFIFAFSALMVGAGHPRSAIDKCYTAGLAVPADDGRRGRASVSADDKSAGEASLTGAGMSRPQYGGGAAASLQEPADQEDFEYVTCWPSWWFVRTIFQAFGEFYLDEMTNDWSVLVVIVIFFIMNVVLMNLLIAMMAGTYESVYNRVELERMIELYLTTEEFSRYSAVFPAPFNIPLLCYELIRFFLKRTAINDHWPNCPWYKQLDLFLSRNSDEFHYREFHSLETDAGKRAQPSVADKTLPSRASDGSSRWSLWDRLRIYASCCLSGRSGEDQEHLNQEEHEREDEREEEREEVDKVQLMKLMMFMERSRKDYLEVREESDQMRKVGDSVNHMHETVVSMLDNKIEMRIGSLEQKFDQQLSAILSELSSLSSKQKSPQNMPDSCGAEQVEVHRDELAQAISGTGFNGTRPADASSAVQLVSDSLAKWPGFMEGPRSALGAIKFGLEMQSKPFVVC